MLKMIKANENEIPVISNYSRRCGLFKRPCSSPRNVCFLHLETIMVLPSHARLATYSMHLRKYTNNIACPHCNSLVLPKDFEKHCLDNNHLNAKRVCVWCMSKPRETWMHGEKNLQLDHLVSCSNRFIDANKMPELEKTVNPKLLDTSPQCDPKSFFDHEDIRDLLPKRAFEDIWVLGDDPEVVYFRDENLNKAASYVRYYARTRDSAEWLHVMVKAASFESFLAAMDDELGMVQTLPFSCWCDGGPYERAWHRHHRHMIVVSEKNTFDNVWSKVKPVDRPRKNYLCKGYQQIVSLMHLINTMGYLCKRGSRCDGTLDGKKRKKGPLRNKHFYIFETLPKDFRLPLALQLDGGIMDVMKQEMFQNVSPFKLAHGNLVFRDLKYRQRVGDFYGFQGGLVLPVRKNFQPVETETPHFVYLTRGRKLYFEIYENDWSDEVWLRRQAARGNCFYDAVRDEYWTPRPRDQMILNHTRSIVENSWKLKSENETLREQAARLKAETEDRLSSAERDMSVLKIENESWKEKYLTLMAESERKTSVLEKEVSSLKEGNACLKTKYKRSVTEGRRLRDKINELQDEVIKQLKAEIKKLNEQLEQLKIENVKLERKLSKC